VKGDGRNAKAICIQNSLQQAFEIAKKNPQKRRRLNLETIDQDVLEVLWVKAVAVCNLSFRLVECPEFRAFLIYLNSDITDVLAKNHSDVKKWVVRQFIEIKITIREGLHSARLKIHISLNL
jgi:hypothetical protein